MAESKDLVNYITDMLQDLGHIDTKYMFGDWGLYLDGLFFAILVDDNLFVKVDDQSRESFERDKLEQFSYMRKGKRCFLSYYKVPDEAIDDIDSLKYWAQLGYQAALRANEKS